jgi:hypothetical protein
MLGIAQTPVTAQASLTFLRATSFCAELTYLGKCLQSQSPCAASGKLLPAELIKHILQYEEDYQRRVLDGHTSPTETTFSSEHPAFITTLKILKTVMQSFYGREDVIPDAYRFTFIAQLSRWQNSTNKQDKEAREVLLTLLFSLAVEKKGNLDPRKWAKGSHTCAWVGCEVTTGLKACARRVDFSPTNELRIKLLLILRIFTQMPNGSICEHQNESICCSFRISFSVVLR